MRFAMFPLHLSKVLRLPRKSDARSYEVLHLSRKIIFPKLTIWCSKMQQLLSGNLRPHLLTHLPHVSLVLRLPRKMHLCRSSSNVPACHRFWKCYRTLTFCSLLTRRTIPCTCHAQGHLNVQQRLRPPQFFALLTSKCASRKNGVHFFDMSTSKSCLFQHLNFQKCSGPAVFNFWLRNVLRATTACTFSTSQLPNMVRPWCDLYILTWKCASHHSGVQLFISHLARWLRTRRFSEPTFRPFGAEKTPCFATFLRFRAPGSSLFWDFLFVDLLSSSLLFSSRLFSDSSHLCFSSVHIVGSLTSKLPLIIFTAIIIIMMIMFIIVIIVIVTVTVILITIIITTISMIIMIIMILSSSS